MRKILILLALWSCQVFALEGTPDDEYYEIGKEDIYLALSKVGNGLTAQIVNKTNFLYICEIQTVTVTTVHEGEPQGYISNRTYLAAFPNKRSLISVIGVRDNEASLECDGYTEKEMHILTQDRYDIALPDSYIRQLFNRGQRL